MYSETSGNLLVFFLPVETSPWNSLSPDSARTGPAAHARGPQLRSWDLPSRCFPGGCPSPFSRRRSLFFLGEVTGNAVLFHASLPVLVTCASRILLKKRFTGRNTSETLYVFISHVHWEIGTGLYFSPWVFRCCSSAFGVAVQK